MFSLRRLVEEADATEDETNPSFCYCTTEVFCAFLFGYFLVLSYPPSKSTTYYCELLLVISSLVKSTSSTSTSTSLVTFFRFFGGSKSS